MQKCEKCSFETGSIIGLARHLKQKHGMILGTSKNTCSYCKKVFTTTTGCKRHIEKKICLPKEESIPINSQEEQHHEHHDASLEDTQGHTLQSYPVQFEEIVPDKKPKSFISALVKVVICSVLFIPFFIKDNKDNSL